MSKCSCPSHGEIKDEDVLELAAMVESMIDSACLAFGVCQRSMTLAMLVAVYNYNSIVEETADRAAWEPDKRLNLPLMLEEAPRLAKLFETFLQTRGMTKN